jgi:hypothetical protein
MKVFPLCTKENTNRTEKVQKLGLVELPITPKLPLSIGDHCIAEYD